MANGKAKGSGFEREVSKKLSLWWSEGTDDSLFWRTQNSGGRFTVRKKVGLQTDGQIGDIASTSPLSKPFTDTFVVELKSYKNINLWSIITGAKGTLVDWWDKLSNEAYEDHKIPLLIVKENFKPILLFSNVLLDDRIKEVYDVGFSPFTSKLSLHFDHFNGVVEMFMFEDFLKIDPNKIKEICQRDRRD